MKITNQVSSLLIVAALVVSAFAMTGCGRKHGSEYSQQKGLPSIQDGVNSPSILDQFSCSADGAKVEVCYNNQSLCIDRLSLRSHIRCGCHISDGGGTTDPGTNDPGTQDPSTQDPGTSDPGAGDHLGPCDPQPDPSPSPSFTPPPAA